MTSRAAPAPGRVQAVPRAAVYGFLAKAFRYPEAGAFEGGSGPWHERLSSAASSLPYGVSVSTGELQAPADLEAAQVEYTRLFDIGPFGPPCPLNEGHYARDRLRTMEEVLRFYDFFGLRFQPETGLLPDHLSVEFEFMEALAGEPETGSESAISAQQDFLERHLCSWLPALHQACLQHAELPFYPALVGFALEVVSADMAYLAGQLRR